jgi:phage terminase Nu1 subunit (DNA packaging protein)
VETDRFLLTVSQYAKQFGIEPRTMAKRLEGLTPAYEKKTGRGIVKKYYLSDVITHMTADRPDVPTESVTADEARRRKLVADAELAELELCKARDEVIPVSDIENVLIEVNGAVRAKLLALPAKTAALLVAETDVHVIRQLLEAEIHQALDELAKMEFDIEAESDSGGDSDPPTSH